MQQMLKKLFILPQTALGKKISDLQIGTQRRSETQDALKQFCCGASASLSDPVISQVPKFHYLQDYLQDFVSFLMFFSLCKKWVLPPAYLKIWNIFIFFSLKG